MSGSAERLVEALEAVSVNPDGLSVTEAARALGMSKAAASRLLAYQRDEELKPLLDAQFQVYTPRTITSGHELLEELQRIRQQGYGLNTGEYLRGHIGVAVPVYDYSGRVTAAVGCSGFAADFANGDPTSQLPAMLDLAQSISAILGYKSGARTIVG